MCEDEHDEELCAGAAQTGLPLWPDPLVVVAQSCMLWRITMRLWVPWWR